MPRPVASTFLTALALTATAVPAARAAPVREWPQTVVAERSAFLVDAAPGPHGRPTALIGRAPDPDEHEVELRTHGEVTPVGLTAYFAEAELDTDDAGAPTVARPSAKGVEPRGIVLWTRQGEQRIDTGGLRPDFLELDVAADGGAVVSWTTDAGIFAARRAPGAATFGPPEPTGIPGPYFTVREVVALPGGGAIVLSDRAVARTPSAGAPFSPPVQLALPEDVRRTTRAQIAAGRNGDVLIVLRTHTRRSGTAPDDRRRIVAYPWPRQSPAPIAPRTLSRTRLPGRPVATAVEDGFAVVFKEARDDHRDSAELHALFLRADGNRTVRGVARGAGPVPTDLTAAPGVGGVRVYGARGDAVRSVWFAPDGKAGPWSVVVRDPKLRAVTAVETGGLPAVLWTDRAGRVVRATGPRER